MIKENEMTKELTLEQADILIDRLVDLEVEEILGDNDKLMEIVYDYVGRKYEDMDLDEVRELAEYHGIIENLEYVNEEK